MIYHNKWISWCIENPLKTYNKVKGIWKPLTRHIKFGKWYKVREFPISSINCSKLLHIDSFDVGWKDKYNSPRHETDPCISITFFKTWRLLIFWRFELDNSKDSKNGLYDMAYWESILDYLYYNFDTPEKAVNNNIWTHTDKNGNKYNTPVKEFLWN